MKPPLTKTQEQVSNDIFATTRWTVVLSAAQPSSQATVALEELCHSYWVPLYTYIRRRGYSKEDAEDLTQSFFNRILTKNALQNITPERGKFRAFLLAALKHFLANEWDKKQCQKRGGGLQFFSMNWQDAEERYLVEPADTLSPDKLYDRIWAITLLEQVLIRLQNEHVNHGKSDFFEKLRPFLMFDNKSIPYAELAHSMNMSEGSIRTAVHRLRHRYKQLLRCEIAQTLTNPQAIDDELQTLFQAFESPQK